MAIKERKIWSIIFTIIGILLSLRFFYKFHIFYYFIPIPVKRLFNISINDLMISTSEWYGLIGLIIGINILIKVVKTKKNTLKLGLIGLGVGLAINVLFYITNPWYTLQTHPRLFFYQDGKNITNKEIYFFLTERYGFKGDSYKPFKTLEDSIDGLEFAKKIKEPSLYKTIFEDSERFGYVNLLRNYHDDSFQLYFLNYILFTSTFYNGKINNLDINLKYLKELLLIVDNYEIRALSKELLIKLNYSSKLAEDEMKQVMDDYLKEYLDKIFDTKTIDKSIFL